MSIMIRGGGVPLEGLAFAVAQIGPAARSFAADAHDCIMVVGPRDPTEYKVVAREFRVPWHGSSTRIIGLGVMPAHWRVAWKCPGSRLALTRLRAPASRLRP